VWSRQADYLAPADLCPGILTDRSRDTIVFTAKEVEKSTMFDLIKRLSELTGPCGEEDLVLDAVERDWGLAGVRVERTRTGSLIGRVGGTGPKTMLIAHADELCYLVRSLDPRGFLWLANGQAWTRLIAMRNWFTVGQRVRILARSGEIPGIIVTVTGHVASLKLPELHDADWDDLWVETGLTHTELVARGVTPGTRVIWDAPCERLGAQIVGKALDDRVGLAVLCELARRFVGTKLACDLTLVCSIQEEIGAIGAAGVAASEKFDRAVVVETGLVGDVPKVGELAVPARLGGGPILVHKDGLVHYDRKVTRELERAAEKAGITLQHAVFGSFGSDGSELMRADIPSAMIAFPTRYTHTPFEMSDLGDIEGVVKVLESFVHA
jgi:putative aminopeptidase FrvX